MSDIQFQVVEDCVLARAAPGQVGIPVSAMLKVSTLAGKGAVMDTDMARLFGAVLVAGTPEALDRLRGSQDARQAAEIYVRRLPASLSLQARQWAVWGEQGASSQCLFHAFTGTWLEAPQQVPAYPRDPADLRRCVLLIEAAPEFASRLSQIGSLSAEWLAISGAWDELVGTLEAESPEWRRKPGSAPATYALLKRLVERVSSETVRRP